VGEVLRGGREDEPKRERPSPLNEKSSQRKRDCFRRRMINEEGIRAVRPGGAVLFYSRARV